MEDSNWITHSIRYRAKFSSKTKKPSPEEYIKENYKTWCFQEIINDFSQQQSGKIKFYLKFNLPNNIFSFFDDNSFYLSIDGYIKNLKNNDVKEILYIYKREDAIKMIDLLNDRIKNICESYDEGFLKFNYYFSIYLMKEGDPTYLFTKKDIEDLMRKADDRVDNKLVIDENGYAKLISNTFEGKLYPVHHETWCCGNNYVGKYSKLNTLDENYISSLEGWLNYLRTGTVFFADIIYTQLSVDELIGEIKKFYIE